MQKIRELIDAMSEVLCHKVAPRRFIGDVLRDGAQVSRQGPDVPFLWAIYQDGTHLCVHRCVAMAVLGQGYADANFWAWDGRDLRPLALGSVLEFIDTLAE